MKIDRIEALMVENVSPATQPQRQATIQPVLSPGEVFIKVCHASFALKDKIALDNTGLIRKFPRVPGNCMTGIVIKSSDPAYQVGDRVVQTGWDIGEHHSSVYGRYACVKSDWGVGDFYADEPLPLST